MTTTRASLLVRIKDRNDSVSWQEFDGIYRPMLHQFARARGIDAAAADDVVQQCMTVVARHIQSFEYDPGKGRFKAWLRTMVNNRVKNLFRDRKDRAAESTDFKREQDREPAPDELFDRLWMDEHLRHCLRLIRDEVEPDTFKAFQSYVMDEKPAEQVCADLGMNMNQLYKIKWRVTQKLGEKMRELLGDESA